MHCFDQIKIACWNVSGIRACFAKEDSIDRLLEKKPDIICLQEVRGEKDDVDDGLLDRLADYRCYWNSRGERKGYAGVATYSRFEPLSVSYGMEHDQFDREGRIVTLEFENYYLINAYVPNAGALLKRIDYKLEWDAAFLEYLVELDSMKPVIVCGDLNVAHKEIDLANPKTNVKNAGFTPEERQDFTDLLSKGFVDTFRQLYPDLKDAYTFWSNRSNARSRNVGWRLDYFVTSERIKDDVEDNLILSDIKGSDHCPIMLLLDLHPEN
jgi:exodeoxyribonuclease III